MKSLMLFVLLSGLATNQAFAQTPNDIVSSYFQEINQPSAVATGALPKAAIKPKPSRELTPMLMFAKANWDTLSEQTQATVSPFFFRPTDTGATPPISSITLFTQAEESVHSSLYFKFHYVTTGANAATLAFVQQLATEADNVWTTEIGNMGYTAPPSDGALGGDNKYDIYLLDVGSASIYGYVTSDATASAGIYPNGAYSYMVLDNDFTVQQFGYANPITPARVTLAHEFFHSIQFGYDSAELPAFSESSATWMEDKVYPTIKDNLQYIGEPFVDVNGDGQYNQGESFTDRNGNGKRESGSQDYPELHLDSFGLTPSTLEQYGRFMWIRYLSDKHGDALIKNILTNTGQVSGNNTYAAIDAALQAAPYNTTLATAFHEFGTWNIDVSKYQNGADYPIAWGDRLFNNGAINISSDATQSLRNFSGKQKHLSTIYELVNSPNATYTFTSTGSVQLSAMTQSVVGGAYTVQAIPLTTGQGSWAAPVGTTKVTFVISNTSATDDSMTWRLTDGVTAPLAPLTPTTATDATTLSDSATTILSSTSSAGGCLSSVVSPYLLGWLSLLLIPILRRKK
ncbi:MAG: hypothetical protein Q9N67_08875 [Ghiorsea sp.]|nr:hypothetical protein [Ghiorsea sp.]